MSAASRSYDAVVIGAGVAGLTAAIRLAERGARVCALAKGVGSTHLAPGTIDVLGYSPERVEEPAGALGAFIESHPEHPYALIGVEGLSAALSWFAAHVEEGPQLGYRYVGELERNHLLPTALGVAKPSALVPETMAPGDVREQAPVCVVGMRVLRDFHARLCAGNLRRAGVQARAVELDVDVGRAEANALGLARRLDDPAFRAAFAARLVPLLRSGERVGVPAILGLLDPHGAWSDLARRLSRPVFEIATLPPSVPGMRLYNTLVAALRRAGGRVVVGAEVTNGQWQGARLESVRAHTSGHDTVYRAESFVLASGGAHSGAITVSSDWEARETVLGLPLRGVPGPHEPRFEADYFARHPMSSVGVAVQPTLRAEDAENVFVAGAALPGAEPWREGSGEGIAIGSGYQVGELAREGAQVAATT